MITDPVPRSADRRAEYLKSDALRTLELPPASTLRALADQIESALADEDRALATRACATFATEVALALGVAPPPVAVLGVRPHLTDGSRCIYEKFGDYDFETTRIRVWMRTAMRRQVTSFGTLLSTLCHEVCHHLDVVRLGFSETPHTRGFYERAGLLYHSARGTPPRPLVWVPLRGGQYRIDWARTMRGGPGG